MRAEDDGAKRGGVRQGGGGAKRGGVLSGNPPWGRGRYLAALGLVCFPALLVSTSRAKVEACVMRVEFARDTSGAWTPDAGTRTGERALVQVMVTERSGLGWRETVVSPYLPTNARFAQRMSIAQVLQLWDSDIANGGSCTMLKGAAIPVAKQRDALAKLIRKAGSRPADANNFIPLQTVEGEGLAWRGVLRLIPYSALGLVAAGLILQAWQMWARLRELRQAALLTRRICPGCRYDRSGLAALDRCPECGHDPGESPELALR